MQCPKCGANHIRKNGKMRGKQNHICVDCGRQFIDVYTILQGYSDAMKALCSKMNVNDMEFPGIERVTAVAYTSVISFLMPTSLTAFWKWAKTRISVTQ